MTLEELKAKRADLEAKLALKKEEKAIADLEKEAGTFEVVEPTVGQAHKQIEDAAKSGADQGKVEKGIVELQARVNRIESGTKSAFTGRIFDQEIVKSFGAEGSEIATKAADLASVLPVFDMVSQLCGKKVYELKAYKKSFGDTGAKGFSKMLQMITAQNNSVASNFVKACSKEGFTKALVSAANGWVPIDTSSSLIEHIKKAKASFNALTVFNMPTQPYRWPISSISGEAKLAGENSGPTAANTGTGDIDFDAKKIKRTVEASEELNEDAAFALMPALFGELVDQVADGLERAVMFGDEDLTNANINSTLGAAPSGDEAYLAMEGLAFQAFNGGTATDQSGAADEATAIIDQAGLLDYRALEPQKSSVVVSPAYYFSLLKTDKVVTLDKIGNNATIITGGLGAIWGMPLFVSSGIPKTDVNGKVDSLTPANNVKDSFLVYRKDKALLGMRRDFKTMQDFDVVNETHTLSASVRADVQNAEIASVGYGYNN